MSAWPSRELAHLALLARELHLCASRSRHLEHQAALVKRLGRLTDELFRQQHQAELKEQQAKASAGVPGAALLARLTEERGPITVSALDTPPEGLGLTS